jgi:hypothetical protein
MRIGDAKKEKTHAQIPFGTVEGPPLSSPES